ncbi:hypothetical protein BJ508DRAFT_309307 [Ascobolus immersus RN42]|uniref:F-box domain-containing protein n=1 Tax=Ascobolus immersus RN42 TaxID=1160509 RepID=A0A3N4HZ37_ASCIM|nr:hypothetical protein BJ508DRAFT_309307 [Ascobolus immersus RN42]
MQQNTETHLKTNEETLTASDLKMPTKRSASQPEKQPGAAKRAKRQKTSQQTTITLASLEGPEPAEAPQRTIPGHLKPPISLLQLPTELRLEIYKQVPTAYTLLNLSYTHPTLLAEIRDSPSIFTRLPSYIPPDDATEILSRLAVRRHAHRQGLGDQGPPATATQPPILGTCFQLANVRITSKQEFYMFEAAFPGYEVRKYGIPAVCEMCEEAYWAWLVVHIWPNRWWGMLCSRCPRSLWGLRLPVH